MFLRSPKHFKKGKQFLNLYSGVTIKTFNFLKINTWLITIFSSYYIRNLIFLTLIKSLLPNEVLKKVSIKYTVSIKLNGWCFIY